MTQAVMLTGNSLWTDTPSNDQIAEATETGLKNVHNILALELGRDTLSDQWWWSSHTFNGNTTKTPHKKTYTQIVKAFLTKVPEDLTLGDIWVKERLSFIELAYRYRADQVEAANQDFPKRLAEAENRDRAPRTRFQVPGSAADAARFLNKRMNQAFTEAVIHLNQRLRLANYKLHYHNGFIQQSQDVTSEIQIAEPFWSLISNPTFGNVDLQMKEAIDRRDRGDRTSAFHAVCALESCIKILSDSNGWTSGNEKGASHYIDNLVSQKNGRFIEPWEGEMLKAMFSGVRNPFAHGPGSSPMPSLSAEQINWSIETAMSWCKSLIQRYNGP